MIDITNKYLTGKTIKVNCNVHNAINSTVTFEERELPESEAGIGDLIEDYLKLKRKWKIFRSPIEEFELKKIKEILNYISIKFSI